jgi:hypothetical protein
MKKVGYILLILFGIIILNCISIQADTGTYHIENQIITLHIQSNRQVVIDYSTKWKVTGGNIPWVTVGLPNSDYTIQTFGGNAQDVKHYDSGGWSGVYVTLDKKYLSGEEFEFNFKVVQNNFVNKYGENASIKFTPVWWDNSQVDFMSISIIPPEGVKGVSTSSEPTKFEEGSVIWEFNNIENGGKRTVGLLMPIDAFPGLNETSNTAPISIFGGDSGDGGGIIWVFIIGIFVVLGIFVIVKVIDSNSSYDSPSMSLSSALSSDKEVTRRIIMKCPNDNTVLEKKTVKDITIDYCPTCGGIHFDKGEVESLIKAGVDEDDLYK